MIGLALVTVVGLVLVHIFVGNLHFLEGTPRSRWLSFAGGVSVAYVFVNVFPELNEGQETIKKAVEEVLPFAEHHVYLVALLGLVIFYGLEHIAVSSRKKRSSLGEEDATSFQVFWIHITSFALYNALIGYLLARRENNGYLNLLFFFIAMALHFLVSDYGSREHYRNLYDRYGRWLLCVGIILGFGIGNIFELHGAIIEVLRALLAGGVLLNVFKEELPKERQSRFLAFFLGTAGYAALLLLI